MTYRIGIDMGGTKIEIVVLDPHGQAIFSQRTPTPKAYEEAVRALAGLVEAAENHIGQTATVGIGHPGVLAKETGLIKNSNSACIGGHPLKRDIETRLGREVRMANDANCFAVSEATDGAGAGGEVVFGVILGTGVGGGVVINGQILVGANSIGGEWGHNPLPGANENDLPLPQCDCGRLGCIEAFLCGKGLAHDYAKHTDEKLAAPEIVQKAADGDAGAEAALQRYELRLARALSSVINLIDPDYIVLGGGVSNIERIYKNVPKLWVPTVFSDTIVTKLVKNKHGDSSGVRGAAWLWR